MARAAGILLIGIILGALGITGYHWATLEPDEPLPRESGGVRSGDEPRVVHAQGTLEPRYGTVLVASPLVGYEIKRLAVQEGDVVQRDQLLLELESSAAEEELKAAESQKRDAQERQESEIELAEQRLAGANLAVKQAEDARELELASQKTRVDVAELRVHQSARELQRFTGLSGGNDPIVSAQQLEQQEVLHQLAKAEAEAAKAAFQRLKQMLDFQLQKAQGEQKGATTALNIAKRGTSLEALDANIALARMKLKQTKVMSPTTGTVLAAAAHEGELISTNPLVQIADLRDMVCVAEVIVADVPSLRIGNEATISSRAFRGQQLRGRVERIGSAASQAALRPVDPRQSVDRTVTKVVLGINAQEAIKSFGGDPQGGSALVGLQVDVEFSLNSPRAAK